MSRLMPFKAFAIQITHSLARLLYGMRLVLVHVCVCVCELGISIAVTIWWSVMQASTKHKRSQLLWRANTIFRTSV